MAVLATTVATLGPPSRRSGSPKNDPGPSEARRTPFLEATASPSITTKTSSPLVPSGVRTCPSWAAYSVFSDAIFSNSLPLQREKRVTPLNNATRWFRLVSFVRIAERPFALAH